MLNRSSLVALLLGVQSSIAAALPVIDVSSFDCSGAQTVSGTSSLTIGCSGNLLLGGGSITADGTLTIAAAGDLSLADVTLSAPNIVVQASNVFIDAGLRLDTDGFRATDPSGGMLSSFVRLPGATISVGGVLVDRPLTPAILVAGLASPSVVTGGSITIMPAVPEPGTCALLLAGLGALLAVLRVARR